MIFQKVLKFYNNYLNNNKKIQKKEKKTDSNLKNKNVNLKNIDKKC